MDKCKMRSNCFMLRAPWPIIEIFDEVDDCQYAWHLLYKDDRVETAESDVIDQSEIRKCLNK